MKVLLIDVNCKSSSTGQIVYNLFSFLNSNGDEAAVCYGRGEKIEEKGIYKFGLDWETYLHALLTRITGYTGCFSFFSTKRLIKYIDEFKPDVVHIHELHAYFVNIKTILNYLAKKNIRVIHTLHCEFSYTGKCGHSVECDKWKTECGSCPHLKDYPGTMFFDHTKHMFKVKKKAFGKIKDLVIVTPSQWLADRAKQSFFQEREIIVIHNGIDTDTFKPVDSTALREELGIKEEKVVLALAPNLLSKEKGGEYVLQIAERLKDKHVKFVLVGVDNAKEETRENVIIKGRIYDKKLLAQYYSMADLFVICSERENFPTTCLEAQCCGTPVIGFDTGGVRETIIGEIKLCNYGNIDVMIQNINNALMFERKKTSSISNNAISVFSKNAMTNNYLKEYERLYITG